MWAKPSGSAPGCSPISGPATPTTRPPGFSTRQARSAGITCPASSRPTSVSSVPIRRFRPYFNHKANRTRRSVLIKIAGGPAPRVYGGGAVAREDVRCYGPFQSMSRMLEAVRTLNDLLGLRDCAATHAGGVCGPGRSVRAAAAGGMHAARASGSVRGPCAGLVTERDYQRRVDTAVAFLEGRTIQPIDRVVAAMQEAAGECAVRAGRAVAGEVRAARVAAGRDQPGPERHRSAHLRLSRPGRFRRRSGLSPEAGVVQASFPYPATPIEHEAFRGGRGRGGRSACRSRPGPCRWTRSMRCC